MSYQVLYRAWRPETFTEICGQEATVKTLRRQVITGHIAHAYLFCGSRGTGKTTAAKVLARAINCLDPKDGDPCGECEVCRAIKDETCMDVVEIDAASNNGVDEVRDLRDRVRFPPSMGKYKVYIIDEVHMLSKGAFNALLKTLEEPPSHAVFILATTEPDKLLATILSRCQRFDFHRIATETIVARLKVVLQGIGREAEDEALMEIARAAEGGLRDALSLLDNCLAHTTEVVTDELARDVLGTTGRAFLFDFVDALIGYDAAKVMNLIAETVSRGSDPAVFAHDVTAHLRAVMLAAACGDVTELADVTPEDAKRYSEQAAKTDFNAVMRMLELFLALSRDMKNSNRARTMLELAAMRACHPEKESAATADERLLRIEKLLEKGVPAASAVRSAVKSAPAAAPEVKAPAVPAAPVPRETPPEAFTEAVRIFSESTPSVRRFLQDMQFGGMKENVVTVEFDPKSAISLGIVKQKQKDLEQVLSDTFGTPIALNVTVMGQAAKKTDAARDKAVKDAITNSYSIFGRENVTVE